MFDLNKNKKEKKFIINCECETKYRRFQYVVMRQWIKDHYLMMIQALCLKWKQQALVFDVAENLDHHYQLFVHHRKRLKGLSVCFEYITFDFFFCFSLHGTHQHCMYFFLLLLLLFFSFIIEPGLVFLQYRSETKRALLPNEITSIDTVRALFVRSFPRQLTMAYLEGPNVKIYIHDASKDMFYELEDVRWVVFLIFFLYMAFISLLFCYHFSLLFFIFIYIMRIIHTQRSYRFKWK